MKYTNKKYGRYTRVCCINCFNEPFSSDVLPRSLLGEELSHSEQYLDIFIGQSPISILLPLRHYLYIGGIFLLINLQEVYYILFLLSLQLADIYDTLSNFNICFFLDLL